MVPIVARLCSEYKALEPFDATSAYLTWDYDSERFSVIGSVSATDISRTKRFILNVSQTQLVLT